MVNNCPASCRQVEKSWKVTAKSGLLSPFNFLTHTCSIPWTSTSWEVYQMLRSTSPFFPVEAILKLDGHWSSNLSYQVSVVTELEVSIEKCGASWVAPVLKNPPAKAGDKRDAGLIYVSERSPGEGHGNLLQYSCLENSMDREAWQATVHKVTKSQTRLKQLNVHVEKYTSRFPCSIGLSFNDVLLFSR